MQIHSNPRPNHVPVSPTPSRDIYLLELVVNVHYPYSTKILLLRHYYIQTVVLLCITRNSVRRILHTYPLAGSARATHTNTTLVRNPAHTTLLEMHDPKHAERILTA